MGTVRISTEVLERLENLLDAFYNRYDGSPGALIYSEELGMYVDGQLDEEYAEILRDLRQLIIDIEEGDNNE